MADFECNYCDKLTTAYIFSLYILSHDEFGLHFCKNQFQKNKLLRANAKNYEFSENKVLVLRFYPLASVFLLHSSFE